MVKQPYLDEELTDIDENEQEVPMMNGDISSYTVSIKPDNNNCYRKPENADDPSEERAVFWMISSQTSPLIGRSNPVTLAQYTSVNTGIEAHAAVQSRWLNPSFSREQTPSIGVKVIKVALFKWLVKEHSDMIMEKKHESGKVQYFCFFDQPLNQTSL